MAKRLFSDSLKAKDIDLWKVLRQAADVNKLTEDEVEKIVKSGKLPKEIGGMPQGSDAYNALQSRLSKAFEKPSDVYNKYIASSKDESILSKDELIAKLEALNETAVNLPDELGLKEYVRNLIRQQTALDRNKKGAIADDYASKIARALIENPNTGLPPGIGNDELIAMKNILENARNVFNAGEFKSLPGKADVSADSLRINDLISAKQLSEDKDASVDNLLSGLNQEMTSSREEFLGNEERFAEDELSRYVPLAEQEANTRGMLFSGDVGDVLSSKALNLESGLEQVRSSLEQEDNQFYYDSAYRNALRKSLDSSEDYRKTIDAERAKVITERDRKFKSYQSDLDRNLDEQIGKNDYERQLTANRARLNSRRDEARDRSREEMISGIAQAGTTIIGNKIAGGFGTGVPGKVGG